MAVIRVRSWSTPFHVGGLGVTWTRLFSVAVRTPRTIRERQAPGDGGFVTIEDCFLVDGRTSPRHHAEVHVIIGRRIEAAAARRLALEPQALAADRPPSRPYRAVRPQMPSAPGKEETPVATPPTGPSTESAVVRRAKRGATSPATTTWEAKRRLLHVRIGQYLRLAEPVDERTGEMLTADDCRHALASVASRRRTESSTRLTGDEMDHALSLVEHKMHAAGISIEALDAEYDREREASR